MAKNKNAGHKGSYGYQKLKEREPRACIRFKCALTNTILDILRQRPGWVEVKEEGEWDFYWCDVSWLRENFDHTYMDEHVRICHFRNHYELTRKNYIVKNLKRFRKQIEREAGKLEATKCDFFPKTFEMPSEYHLFVEEFRKNPGITWIMKPVARSQGRGIFLFRKLKDVIDWRKDGVRTDDQKDETQVENYVAQCYIENPYLIGGRKFDLRVYVLVMSYIPLKAWLYRDGFARFSNTRFTLSSIDDHYVHLTNVAVQKTAPDYDPEKGCKWTIQRFRQYMTAKHGAEVVETLFAEMDNIFIKSLQSVQKVIISDKHCFELYGYDILIDQDLKPLTGKEKRIGGFDLMWNDGPVSRAEGNVDTPVNGSFMANTHLGTSLLRRWQGIPLMVLNCLDITKSAKHTFPSRVKGPGVNYHIVLAECSAPVRLSVRG
ncbi:probable tubulin polyglutamylase TTLL9 isoform X4 [Chelonia mydas]|uniref:probable tubulin polyglutamylase TTLL9 isoform X4 n=1 Tax=Chelonia mydas TaxID=8469 RepID=UPI001CA8836C|nr:probable tubulin polyglutamylase TTLL9 isoform X4 [Chelonia mydas]